MQFWEYALVFLTPLLGGLPAFWVSSRQPSWLQYILTFSGAYLLGLVFLHLLPELYEQKDVAIGKWILAGFGLQIVLEQLSKGIEHGHPTISTDRASRFALQIMIGLTLHALMEGLPLGGYRNLVETNTGFHELLIGILLHNLPAAFALTSFFLLAGFSQRWALSLLFIFALSTPVSAFFANKFIANPKALLILLALVTGNLLQIAISTLFEAEQKDAKQVSYLKWPVFLFGLAISALKIC